MSNTAESAEAILLRRSRFAETSLVLVWLSAGHGKIRTAARGAGRSESKMRGRLDLFYHAEIQFVPGRRSDLHALREVRLIETWAALRDDYRRLLAASYFAELCDLLCEPGQSAPELFDLLRRALGHLCAHQPSRRAVEFFESEVCRTLGLGHADNPLAAIEAHAGRVPTNRRRLAAALE
ncbi:MAG: DNA repair protein RecO [Chthoniobacterales bacterium]|jgi:DNA repair protein RecO (recombination protein O)|nr:DNA repair protein RecO [Chthoniobacterales bacterium]